MPEDYKGQHDRAKKLREQIEKLKTGVAPDKEEGSEPKPGESPREYIERREKELKKNKDLNGKSE